MAYLPEAPPGCNTHPGWIQRTCRSASCYYRSKTIRLTSGGQTNRPAGLHSCQPNLYQQEDSFQQSCTPCERCLHRIAATCGRNRQDALSSGPWGGCIQPASRAQRGAIFNIKPAISTWTNNFQLLRPQVWLHIPGRMDFECTRYQAQSG